MTNPMVTVSNFSRDEYGIKAAPEQSMLNYGYALMVIASGDGELSAPELQWLTDHQRKFGAPEHVIEQYEKFDPQSADLAELVSTIQTDVETWHAQPHLIYHAIQMCRADEDHPEAEKEEVRQAAALLGVPNDIVLTIYALLDMEEATRAMRKALFHVDTL